MNERIKELIARCSFTVTEYSMGIDSSYEDFDKEMFAELIIKECARVGGDIVLNQNEDNDMGVFLGIKQHFGV